LPAWTGKKYYGSEISLEYVHENIGFDLFEETGASMIIEGVTFGGITQKSLDVFDTTDAMIYIATSGGDFPRGIYTPFPVVRRHFGIFANVRPSKTLPNVYSLKPDIDLVLVREQTEGLWMGHEEEVAPGEIIAQVKITTAASEKIGRFACELAMQRNGKTCHRCPQGQCPEPGLRNLQGLRRQSSRGVSGDNL
jgi:isocitrate/isopropylmalate dehydrogenase